jgi:hypothetical protein
MSTTAIYTGVCGPEDAAPAARFLVLKTGYDDHEDDGGTLECAVGRMKRYRSFCVNDALQSP